MTDTPTDQKTGAQQLVSTLADLDQPLITAPGGTWSGSIRILISI